MQLVLPKLFKEKRDRYIYKKSVRRNPDSKKFIDDVELDISLGCFDKLDERWQDFFVVPVNLDENLALKAVKKMCNSSYVNNGCRIYVRLEKNRRICVYISVK